MYVNFMLYTFKYFIFVQSQSLENFLSLVLSRITIILQHLIIQYPLGHLSSRRLRV